MNTLNLLRRVYNGYECTCVTQFIDEYMYMNICQYIAGAKRSHPYVAATLRECHAISKICNIRCSVLFYTSSVNVTGTSPMTASATSRIACFVSHFKVIPVEHKQLQKVRHTLRKNINTLAMLTHDVEHPFSKMTQ